MKKKRLYINGPDMWTISGILDDYSKQQHSKQMKEYYTMIAEELNQFLRETGAYDGSRLYLIEKASEV